MCKWFYRVSLLAIGFLMVSRPVWADCDFPVGEAEQLRCASAELRASDQHINSLYSELRAHLGQEGQKQLLVEQRAWLLGRDHACNLDRRISDRDEWFRALEMTPAKMTCVIRFTNERNRHLSDWLNAITEEKPETKPDVTPAAAPPAPPPPLEVPPPAAPAPSAPPLPFSMQPTYASCPNFEIQDGNAIYACNTIISRRSGKWYFELEVKAGLIAQQCEMALDYGVLQAEPPGGGWLMHIRRSLAAEGDLVYFIGIAVDLDEGFIYTMFQGVWRAKPGEVGGFPVKPRIYTVGRMGGSSDLRPLLQKGLIRLNSGEQPFHYPVPEGYRPFDIP